VLCKQLICLDVISDRKKETSRKLICRLYATGVVAKPLKSQTNKRKLLEARSSQEVAELIGGFNRRYPRDIQVKKIKDGRVIHP